MLLAVLGAPEGGAGSKPLEKSRAGGGSMKGIVKDDRYPPAVAAPVADVAVVAAAVVDDGTALLSAEALCRIDDDPPGAAPVDVPENSSVVYRRRLRWCR